MRENGQHSLQAEAIFRAFQRIRPCVHIDAVRDQDLRRFRVILLGRPHQRRFAVGIPFHFHIRAMLEQETHDFCISSAGRSHQNGAASGKLRVRVRTGRQQRLRHRRVPIGGG